MAPLVDTPQIKSAELLTPLPSYLHAYVWPFTIIWPIFLAYFLTPDLYNRYIQSSEWTFVWVGTIITLQSLVWLSTNWSVNLKATFTATRVKSISDAKLIKVIPIENAGSADICKLEHDPVSWLSDAPGDIPDKS
jgi:cation-transporting ATPase 13A1